MSTLDNLIEKIQNDTNIQIEEIIKSSEEKGKEVFNSFVKKAEIEKERLELKTVDEVKNLKEKMTSDAKLKARDIILSSKQEILKKVFENVINISNSMSLEEYISFVKNNICKFTLDGNEELVIPESYLKHGDNILNEANNVIKNKYNCEIKLSNEKKNIKNGFILIKDNLELNNTIEALIEYNKDEYEKIILNQLL